uniref:Uncharacterized protein n=1 Tax=Seriola lalandi dorsalis TaxID=1841481 RepID=A0A3B4XXM2_SERLL
RTLYTLGHIQIIYQEFKFFSLRSGVRCFSLASVEFCALRVPNVTILLGQVSLMQRGWGSVGTNQDLEKKFESESDYWRVVGSLSLIKPWPHSPDKAHDLFLNT